MIVLVYGNLVASARILSAVCVFCEQKTSYDMRISDWSSDVCSSDLYAGTIADGIAGGSVRAIDPLIAAQTLMARQNAAFDMRKWASTMPRDRAVALYASTLAFGLFDDRVLAE